MWIDTLAPEGIHLYDLPPAADKWGLISLLHASLCKRESLAADLALEISKELVEREKLMSTGIGEQMAIPHAVVPGAPRFMSEMAIIRQGMPFESLDGTDAFIVVLLVAPKSGLHEHLKVMAAIASIFYHGDTRRGVIAAQSRDEVLSLIRAARPPN